MSTGGSSSTALGRSRRAGVGRKTAIAGAVRGGSPPTRVVEAVRGNRYLSQFERQRIATLRQQGLGVREIACRLDRAPSTISRELCRNIAPHDSGIYDSDLAHARARERAAHRRVTVPAADDEPRAMVQKNVEWSPDLLLQGLERDGGVPGGQQPMAISNRWRQRRTACPARGGSRSGLPVHPSPQPADPPGAGQRAGWWRRIAIGKVRNPVVRASGGDDDCSRMVP